MNWLIVITAVTGLVVAVGVAIVALWRVFPWDIGKAVSKVRSDITLPAGEVVGPMDLEDIVYQVMRTRLIMIGLLLAFCALTVICSTMIIVTANNQLPLTEKGSRVRMTKETEGKISEGVQAEKKEPAELENKQPEGGVGSKVQADTKKPAEPLSSTGSSNSGGNAEKPKIQIPVGGS